MKSVSRGDFDVAGTVERVHGNKGELRLELENGIELKEWVFLEIREKPVPFFIESKGGQEGTPVLKLQGIDDPLQAASLVRKNVLIPSTRPAAKRKQTGTEVIGYRLLDCHLGELGYVESVEELPQQLLLHTTFQGRDVLIPGIPEFIVDISKEKKTVYLDLPDGMLEL